MIQDNDDALNDILTRYVQECIGLLEDEIKKTYQDAIAENQRLKEEIKELRQQESSQKKIDYQSLQQRLLADQCCVSRNVWDPLVWSQMTNDLANRKGR